MAGISVKVTGIEKLASALATLASANFQAVCTKSLAQIYNRGKQDGGTPVDTGELRLSLTKDAESVGYTKEYAPHVEYGHRLVNGGYVAGQYFFKANVDIQRSIFEADIRSELAKVMAQR